MRIAVTGATSFIGNAVARSLKSAGHNVMSVGDEDPKIDGVEHRSWGLQKKVNVIVNCAEEKVRWAEDPEKLKADNLELVEHALEINPKARFIHMSSAAVYATLEKDFSSEEKLIADDTKMVNTYALSKALAEHMVDQEFSHRHYILRPRAVYGSEEDYFIPKLKEYANGFFIMPGKNPMGSITSIDNLCEVVKFFVDDIKEIHFGIYNVADSEPVNMHQTIIDKLQEDGIEAKIVRLSYSLLLRSIDSMENKARKKKVAPDFTRYEISHIGRDSVMNTSRLEGVMDRKLTTDLSII